ncbi:hypothetical protein A0J61_00332 [Choanephora cucurbitarum]|uniref:Uncharacterized protein n=1 Tax=Choanephora cucurbitarum TaxID=101091 RepID=A0A1C7NR47_9FUNG|nr:hypothetical protein A0J61_00332 [Choanephora cucurbitarum]
MEKTLIDYDKNLQELERQREQLEIVMQKMGQEWEESGAGIGWLGSLDVPTVESDLSPSTTATSPNTITETPLSELTDELLDTNKSPLLEKCIAPRTDVLSLTHQPLFTNILSQTTGPSPEYLQSLLNVNEALLAESLANNNTHGHSNTTILTPVEERRMFPNQLNSPLITPDDQSNDADSSDFHCNTPRDYLGNVNPDTEMIISPLAPTASKQLTSNSASLRF